MLRRLKTRLQNAWSKLLETLDPDDLHDVFDGFDD